MDGQWIDGCQIRCNLKKKECVHSSGLSKFTHIIREKRPVESSPLRPVATTFGSTLRNNKLNVSSNSLGSTSSLPSSGSQSSHGLTPIKLKSEIGFLASKKSLDEVGSSLAFF